MMYWYGDHMSGWGWVLMTLGTVAFWGLLIAGVVLLIRTSGNGAQPSDQSLLRATPEQLLSERFARGEIDEDDYSSRMVALDTRQRR